MKSVLIVMSCLLAGVFVACNSRSTQGPPVEPSVSDNKQEGGFDSIAAARLGADEYGMRKYVMAFLKKGPNRDLDSAKAAELQMAHMKNIGRMADEGKLILAGPFFGDGDLRGIYIFAVESVEEAEALTNSDPAIQAGSLVMELQEWYGSAAVMAIPDIHKTLSRQDVTE